MDVTIERDWVRTLEALEERHGHLDILVNNAGWSRLLPMSDCSLEDWREIVSVNLDAAFLGMKLSMPMLAASTGGAIVNMSSIRSDLAGVGASAYSAAKSGMAALARVVAIECAQADNGVRVNTVHPGFVETPFSRGMATREQIDAFAGTVPIKRLAQPSEIAAVVAFLASDDASYMTGASVVVDGGFSVV
jgi:3alpha(or 20beta)-hydroxysteroid dehydrogenase